MAGRERASSVRAIILLLLAEGPRHGYELQPQIPLLMGTSFNPAGIYRTLRKLEEEGLVSSSWTDVPGPGPRRRMYQITGHGAEALDAHVTELKRAGQLIRVFLGRYHAALDTADARRHAGRRREGDNDDIRPVNGLC